MDAVIPEHEKCTVIIPTLAEAKRADSLKRAIKSISQGNRTQPKIVLIINGNRYCDNLIAELSEWPGLRLVRSSATSLAQAQLAGRQEVDTPFFGYLDDDDEYLPGAVDARIAVLEANPDVGLVVTNGYDCYDGKDQIAMDNMANVLKDPLQALFKENWIANCGNMFRARDVPVEMFHDIHHLREWTWIAFRLVTAGVKIATLDTPTYRYHADTPGSASKSEEYMLCQVGLCRRMLETNPRPDIVRLIHKRLSHAWHTASSYYLEKGDLALAWSSHLKSLAHPSGFKFLSYTRKLLLPAAKAIFK